MNAANLHAVAVGTGSADERILYDVLVAAAAAGRTSFDWPGALSDPMVAALVAGGFATAFDGTKTTISW